MRAKKLRNRLVATEMAKIRSGGKSGGAKKPAAKAVKTAKPKGAK